MITHYCSDGVLEADNGDILVMPRCLPRQAMQSVQHNVKEHLLDYNDIPEMVRLNKQETLGVLQRLIEAIERDEPVECRRGRLMVRHAQESPDDSDETILQVRWLTRG